MKYREPPVKLEINDDLEFQRENENQLTQTYQVTLLTPLYGGRVDAHTPSVDYRPIRATEILYGLRFWWRLRKLQTLKQQNSTELSKKLFEEERQLWGAPADKKQAWPCRVRVKVDDIKEICKLDWKGSFHSYALFPAAQDKNSPHKIIKPDLTFNLTLTCEVAEKQEDVKEALIAWANFGGIGARTRRGLGAVKVLDKDNNLLTLLDEDTMLNKYGCLLVCIPNDYENAIDAGNDAIEKLYSYSRRMLE